MPNFAGRGAPSFGAGFKGLADMLASALRGGVVGTFGGAGDIESMLSSGNSHLLPRSEDLDRLLPPVNADKGFKTFEELGGFVPTSGAKVAAKAAPAGAAAFMAGAPKPKPMLGPKAKQLAIDHTLDELKDKKASLQGQLKHLNTAADPDGTNMVLADEIANEIMDVHAAIEGFDHVNPSWVTGKPNNPLTSAGGFDVPSVEEILKPKKLPVVKHNLVSLKSQEAALQKEITDLMSSSPDVEGLNWDVLNGLTDSLNDIQDKIKEFKAVKTPQKLPLQLKSVEETGGSLWPGSKRNDLALVHASPFSNSQGEFEIPSELTHPSLMIPAPKSNVLTNFGNNLLIADPRKFEPRTSGSIIKSTDFYTPRRGEAFFKGVKQPGDRFSQSQLLRLGAKERLADKNPYRWEKGGAFQEIGSSGATSPWGLTTKYSPQFSSFKHFEESPKGLAKLDLYDPSMPPQQVTEQYSELLRRLGNEGIGIRQPNVANVLRPQDERFTKNRFKFNQLHEPEFWQQHGDFEGKPISGKLADLIVSRLRNARKDYLEHAPSEYAEVKRYGHVPITGESFTHAIVQPELYNQQADWLRNRGVTPINYQDVLEGKSILGGQDYSRGYVPDEDLIKLIANLQAQTLRRR